MKNNSKVPIEFKVTLDSEDADIRRGVEFKRFGNLEKANFKSIIGKIVCSILIFLLGLLNGLKPKSPNKEEKIQFIR